MFLEQFCAKLKLYGALLTTYDGEIVDSQLSETLSADDAVLPVDIIVRLFDELVRECQYTFPDMLIMDGEKGIMDKIICTPVKNHDQILFLFAQGNINVGMIRIVLEDFLTSDRQDTA